MAIVETIEELKKAIDRGDTYIVIRGDLAKDVKNSYELKKISKENLPSSLSSSVLSKLFLCYYEKIKSSILESLVEKYEIIEYKISNRNEVEELKLHKLR